MAEDAKIKLGYDDAEVKRGLAATANQMKSFSGKVQSSFSGLKALLPAISVAGTAAAIKGTLSSFDDIADASAKLGETPETIQRVQRAAELSGSSLDEVSSAMIKLERGLGDVENTKAAEALERFGVTAEGLMAQPLDQKLITLSNAFKQARQEGTGVADLQDLLGKGSAALIPLLEEGGRSIEDMFANTEVMADGAVFQMALLNDQIDNMIANLKTKASKSLVTVATGWGAIWATTKELLGQKGAVNNYVQKIADEEIASEKRVIAITKSRKERAKALADKRTERNDGKDAADAARRATATTDLAYELAIAQAKQTGDDKRAKALERENDIRKRTLQIIKETGMAEDQARKVAEQLAGPDKEGGRIKGANAAKRAAAMRGLEGGGLDEWRRLQIGGRGERKHGAFGAADSLEAQLRPGFKGGVLAGRNAKNAARAKVQTEAPDVVAKLNELIAKVDIAN